MNAAAATIPAAFARPTAVPAAAASNKTARVDLSQDAQWLAGYRAGDRAAMERLFRTYSAYVMALLRNGCSGSRGGLCHVAHADSRLELMQEVFVRVLSPAMRTRYDHSRPFTAFLRGVTRNVMLEHVRRVGLGATRNVALDDGTVDMLEFWSPSQPLPDELFEGNAERALMRDFLATLTTEERRFITVRFEGGQSQRDAADALGLGRQQVRRLDDVVRGKLATFMRARGHHVPAAA